jgi:hypothetical protein
VDRRGVVVVVADQQVLVHLQQEVVTSLAEHDATPDSRRSHGRALQDLRRDGRPTGRGGPVKAWGGNSYWQWVCLLRDSGVVGHRTER